ncbi:MAG: helix-turn-helix domain-containing protein [Bradymonadales bacterium]
MHQAKRPTKIIAIAGPKGGVGKSSLAIDLGRSLAQRDLRVLLVEIEPYKQGLAILLEMPLQSVQTSTEFTAVATPIPKLDLLLTNPKDEDITASFAALRAEGEYDFVIVDLASSLTKREAQVLLSCDLPVLISNAEPASLFAATQCLRLCAFYALMHEQQLRGIMPLLDPVKDSWDFLQIYKSLPQELQDDFAHAMCSIKVGFILNQRRESSENQQCEALCHAWGMLLGITPRFLGSLAHEEKRWFFARRIAPSSQFPREEAVINDLNHITKQVIEACESPNIPTRCLPTLNISTAAREFLLAAKADDVRIAYRKLWEGYRRENGLISAIMHKDRIAEIIQNLELAHRFATQVDEEKTALSLPNLRVSSDGDAESLTPRRLSGSFRAVHPWSAEDCPPEAGQIIKDAREAMELSIQVLALQTRIPKRALESIESCDFADLESRYLRAYLIELAHHLKLDEEMLLEAFGFVCV